VLGLRQGEAPVVAAAGQQPGHRVRVGVLDDRGPQPVEPPDEHGDDEAVLAAEAVVDAHRRHPRLGGDRPHGDAGQPVPDEHPLGSVDQRLLDRPARCAPGSDPDIRHDLILLHVRSC
jgi:hypothetical protein